MSVIINSLFFWIAVGAMLALLFALHQCWSIKRINSKDAQRMIFPNKAPIDHQDNNLGRYSISGVLNRLSGRAWLPDRIHHYALGMAVHLHKKQ